MAHDAFISYSSKDKPTADAVCATLESRGIRCWIAPRDVLPGEEYAAALVNAIHSSRLLILVFSSGANQSPQVLREVERAVSRGLPILPLRIENVAPSASMEYYISSQHWLDALTEPLERHLVLLADTVKLLLSRMPGPVILGVPEPAVKPVPPISAQDVIAPLPPTAEFPAVTRSPVEPPPVKPVPPVVTKVVTEPAVSAPPKAETQAPKPPIKSHVARPEIPKPTGRGRAATAALVMQGMLGAYYAGNQFFSGQVIHWSSAEISLMYSVSALAFGLGCLAGGLRSKQTTARKVAMAGGILFGAGILLAGLVTALIAASEIFLWTALTYGLVAAFGQGLGFIASLSTLLRWFPDKRGWMMGVAGAAFTLGIFVVGVIVRPVVSTFGWAPALMVLGILSLIVLLLAARRMQDPSADQVLPTGRQPAPSSYDLSEALGRWQWYALWALLLLNSLAGASLLSLAIGLAREAIGVSFNVAAQITGMVSAAGILGYLFWGWISDRIGRRWALVAVLVPQAGLMLVLPGMRDISAFTALVFIIVFCNTGGHGLMPAFAADCFGVKSIAAIYGVMLTAGVCAVFLGRGLLSPMAYNGSGATQALYLLGALLLLATAIPLLVRPARIKAPAERAETSFS